MELLHFDDTGPFAAPTLVVLLPGAYSGPQEFVDEGFVQALRQRRLQADVVVAGARIEHYIEGPVLDRLHEQVVAPARARGVRQVWLVGISLGGLFALAYAARQAEAERYAAKAAEDRERYRKSLEPPKYVSSKPPEIRYCWRENGFWNC